jgi:hypothetical protein
MGLSGIQFFLDSPGIRRARGQEIAGMTAAVLDTGQAHAGMTAVVLDSRQKPSGMTAEECPNLPTLFFSPFTLSGVFLNWESTCGADVQRGESYKV